MLKLCIVGGLGRMGVTIASLVGRGGDFITASVLETGEALKEAAGKPAGGPYAEGVVMTSDPVKALEVCDVAVDFSLAGGFETLMGGLARTPRPLVTGTTGIEDKASRLRPLAERVAVVDSPNMSVGVNILFAISGLVARLAGEGCDIEIVEAHHRTKKDVPSGTALEIARLMGAASGRPVQVGRARGTQTRGDEVFIHSLRMGSVAGEHTVSFSLEGEILRIEHTALSRECFAAGALRAARFAAGAPPGMYSMLDVLELKSLER
jgi:4-hydroxy-tetrahydrodipicolinate reductase